MVKLEKRGREEIWEINRDCERNKEEEREIELKMKVR